jgi:predicted nucleotide-binding protein (sugar kinase/HSP70/actin superfamily)
VSNSEFTPEMKKTYKLLIPNMMDIHFRMLRNVFIGCGYDAELLTNTGQNVIEEGLKYVHNDICYPALLVIGQLLCALKSGKYDLNRTAVMMSQTGGGCRASNYIHLIRKALENAGMGQIPVVSVNLAGLERNSGFQITLSMLRKAIAALAYGDMLMLLRNQTKPYELNRGESEALVDHWVDLLSRKFEQGKAVTPWAVKGYFREIVSSFEAVGIHRVRKIKVGIVGEIYLKYSPFSNNNLEQFLASQDCEVMIPGVMGFILYMMDNSIEDVVLYGGRKLKKWAAGIAKSLLKKFETYSLGALKGGRFVTPSPYEHLRELVKPVIGFGCKMGEGWLLPAEMMELVENGYENIVCVQPFGCLPNHIVGKGMIRKIRELRPFANIVAVDYDPGATKVNQENRIKLMLSVARERLAAGGKAESPGMEGLRREESRSYGEVLLTHPDG